MVMQEQSEKDDKIEEFLIRLTELSQEMGVSIGGCGECGSPWVKRENAKGKRYVCTVDGYDYLQLVPLKKLKGN